MNGNNGMSCQQGCWLLAAGAGLVIFVLLLTLGGYGVIGSIFLGGLLFVVLGALLSWLFCRSLPAPGEARPGADRDVGKPASAAASTGAPASASTASDTKADTGTEASTHGSAGEAAQAMRSSGERAPSASSEADAEAGASVKPSKPLAGQDELAARKGEWKYGGAPTEPKPAANPGADGAAATQARPKADDTQARPKADDVQHDGPGTRPEGLDAPREGGADDLKKIKGVGPKLEQLCHELGFYHYDQIANWGPEEVAWVDQNLQGFKGRVTRDNWVEQAKTLAAGGETAFSKKVDKGDVY